MMRPFFVYWYVALGCLFLWGYAIMTTLAP